MQHIDGVVGNASERDHPAGPAVNGMESFHRTPLVLFGVANRGNFVTARQKGHQAALDQCHKSHEVTGQEVGVDRFQVGGDGEGGAVAAAWLEDEYISWSCTIVELYIVQSVQLAW